MIVLLHVYLVIGVLFVVGGILADYARTGKWPDDPWSVIFFVAVVGTVIWPWIIWDLEQDRRKRK